MQLPGERKGWELGAATVLPIPCRGEGAKAHTAQLKTLTASAAPDLVASFGIGFDSAAELLITAGDNTDRVRSEAAFAKLCGACPIAAGSGRTDGRHRLNRGGNVRPTRRSTAS